FPAQELPPPGNQQLPPLPPGFPLTLQDLALLATSDFPSADQAVPSYLRDYRGLGRIQAHQYIPGYERFKVGQFDFTAIKAVSSTLGADQIIFIGEVGGTQVFNMPSRDKLQLEGGGPYRTHASPGADGTGTPDGQPDPHHLNPTQQTHG